MFPLPLPGRASSAVSLPLRPGLSITGIYSVLPSPRVTSPPAANSRVTMVTRGLGPGGLPSSSGGTEFKSTEVAALPC